MLNELGRIYKKQNKIISALQVFEQIVSKTNDDIIALYEIAKIYKKLENVDKAIEYYSKIIKIAPNDSRAVVGLFYCYFDYGKLEEAHEVLMNHTGLQNNKYYQRCAYLCKELYKKKDTK